MATYFVGSGSDSNSGSVLSPWQTIAYGVSRLAPGDSLYIRGGTYSGAGQYIDSQTQTVPSGTSGARITISGYPGESVVLQAGFVGIRLTSGGPSYLTFQDFTLDLSPNTDPYFNVNAAYLSDGATQNIFQRLEVKNSRGNGFNFSGHNGDCPFNTILNCHMHDNGTDNSIGNPGYGAYIEVSHTVVDGCHIHNNHGYGLQFNALSGFNHDNIIRNNRVHDNFAWNVLGGIGGTRGGGIVIMRDNSATGTFADSNQVYNNRVYHNGFGGGSTDGAGIQIYSYAQNTSVYYNTVYDNNLDGILLQFYSPTGNVLRNNISYGNVGDPIHDYGDFNGNFGHYTADHNLSTDPTFVDAAGGDFHLQAGSAAIDAGINVGITTDADGNSRPQGGGYDIGAYEYPTSTTHHVASGGNLQAAINAAQPGDTITLESGATFTGNFVLPVHGGTSYITIQSDGAIPAPGVRATPTDGAGYAIIQATPGGSPAITALPQAAYWSLIGLRFLFNPTGDGEVISLGNGDRLVQTSTGQVPHHLVIDRCYINATPTYNTQKRAIGLNSGLATIQNCYIAGVKNASYDSQAIAGWNGPGPFLIDNNYLEAASENVLFGGGDAADQTLMPSDITVTHNLISKDLSWRGQGWRVKNLFELKNARRVTVDSNTMTYSWGDSQNGFAVLINVRNQDLNNPWATIQDVKVTNNRIAHAGGAMQILGHEDRPGVLSGTLDHLLVQDNLFDDISAATWAGTGNFLQLNTGGDYITIDHNDCVNADGSVAIYLLGSIPFNSLVITNNIFEDHGLGVQGDQGFATGTATLAGQAPGYVYTKNVQVSPVDFTPYYPAGQFFPATLADVGFTNLAGHDYSLTPVSAYHNAATDGTDIGVRFSAPIPPPANWPIDGLAGAYVLTGAPATLRATRRETTGVGSYGMTGAPATLLALRRMTTPAGSYGLVGADVTFVVVTTGGGPPPLQYFLSALAGHYDLTGFDGTGVITSPAPQSYVLTAGPGSYLVDGIVATFAKTTITTPPVQYVMSALAGQYDLTGFVVVPVTISPPPLTFALTALAGSYFLDGIDTTFARTVFTPPPPLHFEMSALGGQYDLTGAVVGFVTTPLVQPPIQYAATVPPGAYAITGADVTFVYVATPPGKKPPHGKKKRLVPLPTPTVDCM